MKSVPTPSDNSPSPSAATRTVSYTSILFAWLTLGRVSNLPTVWTNVMVGGALAILMHASSVGATVFPLHQAMWLGLAMSLFYVAGMILNDVCDARVDAIERPRRPIPVGRVNPRHARLAVLGIFGAGMGIIGATQPIVVWPVAGLLVAFVVAYDLGHRTGAWSVLLLAGVRACVYLAGAFMLGTASLTDPGAWRLWLVLGIVMAYLVVLSLIARYEAGRPSQLRVVLWLLRGITLLDGVFLLWLGWPGLAIVAVGCFALTALLHRWIAGT